MDSLDQHDPLMDAVRASARSFVSVGVFSGLVNLLMLAGPFYMLQVYDRVLPSRNTSTLVALSGVMVVVYLAQGYFEALRARMLLRIGALFDANLQGAIHVALATLPLRGAKPLLAQQPLRDLDQVRTFLSGIGPTAFLDMPWAPLFVIVLFLFHPVIGLLAVAGAVAIAGATLATVRQSRRAATLATDAVAQRQVLADATRVNADAIRALGMTRRLAARWSTANERYLDQSVRAGDIQANLGSGAKILRFALQSAVLGTAAYLVVVEQASGGIMIASSIMMGRALAPVEVALSSWKQLVAARQGIVRLRAVLTATAPTARPAVVLARPEASLQVQSLSVVAPGSGRVLVSDVTFSLAAGAGLALLGPSASGKTSLTKALVGVLPASAGVVRLDGAAFDQWASDDLGCHIGYLPQEVGLLGGTVAENIARFDAAAPSEAIIEAARIAGAHELILGLPQGYATAIGEGGAALSAGQRQRLGLARAVYGEPFLVVLDEPNANLDADGENALSAAIRTLRERGCIVIVVSHRPSALASLDTAMVLYGGKMIAFGPREAGFARVAAAGGQQRGPRQAPLHPPRVTSTVS